MIRSLRGRLFISHLLVVAAAIAAAALLSWLPALLLALALGAVLVVAVTSRHAARFDDLERVARRMAADDPTARAVELPADELGRLGRAMNHMASEGRARLETLRGERDEREHILAQMSDGVALLDGEGRVVRANHALAAVLAEPRPPEPGTRFTDYVRNAELHALVDRARRERHPVEGEVRFWTPEPRLIHAGAAPLGEEPLARVVLVVRDLTEIESVSRMRQDFVANVSHELRTPLTTIRGYAETLLDGGLEDASHRRGFVESIRGSAARLEQLVSELLSLSELERGGSLRFEPLDLRALAEAQLTVARATAERAGLELTLAPGDPAPFSGDRFRIEQVLANLLDNALKYTERGGVDLRVGAEPGRVWCEITDTGPGIPSEDQPRIFERFYRVDKARSREKGGTGLGLSIVKHVITLHGGDVSVRSAPGQGSTFRFEIPQRALAALPRNVHGTATRISPSDTSA